MSHGPLPHIFRVKILEGDGFGPDLKALQVSGTLGGVLKSSLFSVGAQKHVWQSTLSWDLTPEQLRTLQASGLGSCKLVVRRKDGTTLGWAVTDLRRARLQQQYQRDPQGAEQI